MGHSPWVMAGCEKMSDVRAALLKKIDLMSDEEVVGLREFLGTYPDSLSAHCRRVPVDPEPLSDEAIREIREADEWFEQNDWKRIPHEEIERLD